MIEPKFTNGDYIINRKSKDMGVFDKVDKKGYMHFKYYYSGMFENLKDVSTYTLFVDYQKFFELCNDEEKEKLDNVIKEQG